MRYVGHAIVVIFVGFTLVIALFMQDPVLMTVLTGIVLSLRWVWGKISRATTQAQLDFVCEKC